MAQTVLTAVFRPFLDELSATYALRKLGLVLQFLERMIFTQVRENLHVAAFEGILQKSARRFRGDLTGRRGFVFCLSLIAIIFSLAVFSDSAFAQSSASITSNTPRLQPTFPLDELSVGVGQEIYFNHKDMTSGARDYTRFSTRLRSSWQRNNLGAAINFGGSFSSNVENENVFEVPEAYSQWRFLEDDSKVGGRRSSGHLRIGRKLENWSQLDSIWKLGLWQPLNRFDMLRPSEQGLTGLFVDLGFDQIRALFFVSSVFIPEQGPTYRLDDGIFSSNSPWFETPGDKLILYSKETDLRYKVQVPTVGEVINQRSFGALLGYGGSGAGVFGQIAYARKPRNQIALPFEGKHLTTETTQESVVTIYPRVVHHNLVSGHLGYRAPVAIFSLAAIYDVSEPTQVSPKWTSQEYEPLTMISPSVEFRAFGSKVWGPRVRVSGLHAIGGAVKTVGPDNSADTTFNPRTTYRDAFSIQMRSRLNWSPGWLMEPSVQWIEELSEHGSVLSGRLQFNSSKGLRLGVFADFLASRRNPDDNVGFISRYRGNDRFGADMAYVF